ncbi:MAG: EAL domain-containing protein, partial [Acidobacteriota bacterium]
PGLLSRSTILDPQGHATAMVGAVRDITDRKRNEEALRESQERYALTAAGANDGLWDWDLRTGTVYYSPRWAHTLGYHEQEIGDTLDAWLELVHPEERSALERQLERHLAGGSGHFETEHRMRTKSGAWRWVQTRGLAVRDETGTVYRMAGSQRDITDRKEAEKKLSHQALHDDLTGLPNRALFMDRLEHAVRRASRKKEYNFGVIFLDLDRFKVINDSLGHMAGDQLLTSIARRLESCLRMGDTVARLGGDEFAILVEELEDQKQIDRVAERVQEELSEPFTIFGREVFTSASLGIALSSSDYERPADILRDADTAMYRAKALGRTRQVRFDPEMHTSAVAQLAMETDLRRALERDELTLRYLPTVDLESGRMRGVEALVRWNHPEKGLIAPMDFLPLAHEIGLINEVCKWVLTHACKQMMTWRDELPAAAELGISVNLDSRQIDASILDRVRTALDVSGLDAAALTLELTEIVIMQNAEVATTVLSELRSLGVGLDIDDFGTGFSSLSHLHRFPIDVLKIDRSFVSRMTDSADELEIVRTIVVLAHNLRLTVVAEGIETEAQLTQLRALGCEAGQGYLFSEPIEAESMARLIEQGIELPEASSSTG